MGNLFRYIEHAFAVPGKTDSIEVENQSDFQEGLRAAADSEAPHDRLRDLARDFLALTFPSPAADPTSASAGYLAFADGLATLTDVNVDSIEQLVETVFDQPASDLTKAPWFQEDKVVLQNATVAIKIVTGFDSTDTAALVRQLRAVEVLDHLVDGAPAWVSRTTVDRWLARPIRIDPRLLVPPPRREVGGGPTGIAPAVDLLYELRSEVDSLEGTYRSLMALEPRQLEVVSGEVRAAEREQEVREDAQTDDSLSTSISFVRLGEHARRALAPDQREILERLSVDVDNAPFAELVGAVRRRLTQQNQRLLPVLSRGPERVYRVGLNVFAAAPPPMHTLAAPAQQAGDVGAGGPGAEPLLDDPADGGPAAADPLMPDFSFAITRPVGYGNLQVVRQELIGYETGEVSHIENVLEGELLRRGTRREEVHELTLTDETSSSQSQERDQQSTSRNELASETQKEAGYQTVTAADQTTSSEYGKLVENSKTNFAQSVTSRAVDTVTSAVRQQRVQRERTTFVEDAAHELDNKDGAGNVRGIYQWVDKKYKVRVLNYGKRLLYDVVVPEPAAFLIESLEEAVQPESFQLTKPVEPAIGPSELGAWNYAWYAAQYGVTGTVKPPPQDFTQTVAHVDALDVQKELSAFGTTTHGAYFGAFTVQIPENYRAVSGFIQRTNVMWLGTPPDHRLEFFVGESMYVRFGPTDVSSLNHAFTMAGETGQIPVTLRSINPVVQFNFAVGINCQRTDAALEQWQLATHAAIMAGYQRQLADYQDKLGRFTAAVRAQMAFAGNYAHDPTIERDELKKAFLFLLLGEHSGAYLPTPAPAPVPPFAVPPDPTVVKDWGAMVAFFERAFEWDNLMYTFYPYFWGRPTRWREMVLTQDSSPQFEAFLKAGAARVVIPVRPGFEAALAHFHETGDVWLGEEMPDMFSDYYLSIIAEIKASNYAPGSEVCIDEWEVTLPTTLVMLKDDEALPTWTPPDCEPPPEP